MACFVATWCCVAIWCAVLQHAALCCNMVCCCNMVPPDELASPVHHGQLEGVKESDGVCRAVHAHRQRHLLQHVAIEHTILPRRRCLCRSKGSSWWSSRSTTSPATRSRCYRFMRIRSAAKLSGPVAQTVSLHAACCILCSVHVACCVLHVACCVQHVCIRCMVQVIFVHVAHYLLRFAGCIWSMLFIACCIT